MTYQGIILFNENRRWNWTMEALPTTHYYTKYLFIFQMSAQRYDYVPYYYLLLLLLLLFVFICSIIITHTLRSNLFCFHFVVLSSFTFVAFTHFLFYQFSAGSMANALPCIAHSTSLFTRDIYNNRREIGKFFKCRMFIQCSKDRTFSICLHCNSMHTHTRTKWNRREKKNRIFFSLSVDSKLNRFISFFSVFLFLFVSFTIIFFTLSIVSFASNQLSLLTLNSRKARRHGRAKRGLNYKLSYFFQISSF